MNIHESIDFVKSITMESSLSVMDTMIDLIDKNDLITEYAENDIMNDIEKEKNENNKLSQHTQHITEFLTRIKNSQSTLKRLVENEKIMRIPDVVCENRTFELFLSTKPSQPEKAVCHSFIIKKDRYTNINWKKPFISHYEVETESFVDSVPFNEGAERLAYYLYDNKLKMNFVAKRKRI